MSLIEKLIRPEIRELSAYHVQNGSGLIKLDAMENPYDLPAELKEAWLDVLKKVDLNRYPDPSPLFLKQALKQAFSIPDDLGILLGNGSDELIQILALALSKKANGDRACVLAPEPGFVMYKMIANYVDMDYVGVPLNEDDFSLPLDDMLKAMETHQPSIIYIAYPNNPTGNLFNQDDIKTIIEQAPGLVVVDEAYNPFADGNSFMSSLQGYDNLIVMRTVSKMGLAGLRFGYMAANQAWIDEFDKVRMPYNINVLTQASLAFALENKQVFDLQAALLCAERSNMFTALSELPGVKVFPSMANFILFKVDQADAVFQGLKTAGILIKKSHQVNSPLENCLRVTIGKPEENSIFLKVLKDLLN